MIKKILTILGLSLLIANAFASKAAKAAGATSDRQWAYITINNNTSLCDLSINKAKFDGIPYYDSQFGIRPGKSINFAVKSYRGSVGTSAEIGFSIICDKESYPYSSGDLYVEIPGDGVTNNQGTFTADILSKDQDYVSTSYTWSGDNTANEGTLTVQVFGPSSSN